MLQTFSQALVVAEYYANKDYIAKNLCENRDKPKMHCDGKCCLKKKLAKQNKDASAPGSQKEEQIITLYYSNDRVELPAHMVQDDPRVFTDRNDLRTFSFHSSVFHPPAA